MFVKPVRYTGAFSDLSSFAVHSPSSVSRLAGSFLESPLLIRPRGEVSPASLFFDCGLRNRWRGLEPTKVRKKGISERGNAAIHSDARVVISLWKNCGNWIPNVASEPKKTHTPKQSETEHIGAGRKLYGLTKAVNASVKRVVPCQNNVVKVRNGSVLLFPSCPQGIKSKP